MSWFESSFGERYVQLYAHRDSEEAAGVVDLLFGSSALAGQPMLDLACGGGRYLAQLQARGARAIGLDLSPVLLRRAKRVARTGSLVRADMRRLPLADAAAHTTWCMFTSFGYFNTVQAHRDLAVEIARVTRDCLALDLPDHLTLRRTLVASSEREVPGWTIHETRWMEDEPRVVAKTMRWIEDRTGEEREVYEERVMLFSLEEIEAFFAPAGLTVTRAFSDYQGTGFDAGAGPRMLLTLEREST